jgi:hypothetical protein
MYAIVRSVFDCSCTVVLNERSLRSRPQIGMRSRDVDQSKKLQKALSPSKLKVRQRESSQLQESDYLGYLKARRQCERRRHLLPLPTKGEVGHPASPRARRPGRQGRPPGRNAGLGATGGRGSCRQAGQPARHVRGGLRRLSRAQRTPWPRPPRDQRGARRGYGTRLPMAKRSCYAPGRGVTAFVGAAAAWLFAHLDDKAYARAVFTGVVGAVCASARRDSMLPPAQSMPAIRMVRRAAANAGRRCKGVRARVRQPVRADQHPHPS